MTNRRRSKNKGRKNIGSRGDQPSSSLDVSALEESLPNTPESSTALANHGNVQPQAGTSGDAAPASYGERKEQLAGRRFRPQGMPEAVSHPHSRNDNKEPVPSTSPQTPHVDKQPGPGAETSTTSVCSKALVPSTASSEVQLPPRPNYGTDGRCILLVSNYFNMTLPDGQLYHYDVEISKIGVERQKDPRKLGIKSKYRCLNTKVNRAIVARLVKPRGGIFDGAIPAFDGRKSMYFRTKLPQDSYEVTVPFEEDGTSKDYSVAIQFVSILSMSAINKVYEGGSREGALAVLQAIHCILKHSPAMTYTPVGRSFFKKPEMRMVPELGGGKEVWFGFTPTVHLCQWKPMLNLNVTATTFYKAGPLIDFIGQVLNDKDYVNKLEGEALDIQKIKKLNRILPNMKVRVTHLSFKPKPKVLAVTTSPASKIEFKDEEGRRTTVAAYFKKKYRPLRYPNLPCIQCGTDEKPKYFPVEVCEIPENFHSKTKLSRQEAPQMIKMTAIPPAERFQKIDRDIQALTANKSSVASSFGINIDVKPLELEGRVLDPPQIVFQRNMIWPKDGQWDMRSSRFLHPASVDKWAVLSFSCQLMVDLLDRFLRKFQDVATKLGMKVERRGEVYIFKEEDVLGTVLKRMAASFKFLLIILNPEIDNHNAIKLICERDLGLATQCCMEKNVYNVVDKMLHQPLPALLVNLCHKVNAKCGGDANTISKRPAIFEEPVIILGADVNHPAPNRSNHPSYAALVGSLDSCPSKYHASVRIQRTSANSNEREIIKDLKGMVKEALRAFYKKTRQKPRKIIFYRDGVSEGQFAEVLNHELPALRQACKELEDGYTPAIVFILVQKRHSTRFMPKHQQDGVGRFNNVPPGTTVDRIVTHPKDFDFFLCSHAGIQGTSRPTHYYVLHDDVGFQADELQSLTFYLCHTYARCPRSVSIPAPAYYAHWVAFRANQHAVSALGDGQSSDGVQEMSDADIQKCVDAVSVKESLRNSMYFV
ncbi:protein argonaute-2 [Ixodes scapularis]|uniref:protein argonaute-2 n=1 Tax=Ixodes scapularis TaxID=6945 RepID=UPI001C387623|nr:protein argonaute-2 [Ixodes scapularis]XP_029849130.3 protein argonaute-2 [Ixodes scapularis]